MPVTNYNSGIHTNITIHNKVSRIVRLLFRGTGQGDNFVASPPSRSLAEDMVRGAFDKREGYGRGEALLPISTKISMLPCLLDYHLSGRLIGIILA
jgi:hypothetical protein